LTTRVTGIRTTNETGGLGGPCDLPIILNSAGLTTSIARSKLSDSIPGKETAQS
jgi:hypothetical protein